MLVLLLSQELAPKHAQIHATLNLFPSLTALDLSGEAIFAFV